MKGEEVPNLTFSGIENRAIMPGAECETLKVPAPMTGDTMDIKKFFSPPADFDGMLWPTITDQIELITRRRDQIVRVLDHYTGKERDYESLSREKLFLDATVHSLHGVRQLLMAE